MLHQARLFGLDPRDARERLCSGKPCFQRQVDRELIGPCPHCRTANPIGQDDLPVRGSASLRAARVLERLPVPGDRHTSEGAVAQHRKRGLDGPDGMACDCGRLFPVSAPRLDRTGPRTPRLMIRRADPSAAPRTRTPQIGEGPIVGEECVESRH